MADRNNEEMLSGDILSQLTGSVQRVDHKTDTQNRLLGSIDATLKEIIRDSKDMSSANAINAYGRSGGGFAYRDPRYSAPSRSRYSRGKQDAYGYDADEFGAGIASEIAQSIFQSRGGIKRIFQSVLYNLSGPVKKEFETSVYDILDGIEKSVRDAVNKADKGGRWKTDFTKRLDEAMSTLAQDLGVDVKDIKKGIGRELGKKLLGNSDFKAITDFGRDFAQTQLTYIQNAYKGGKSKATARNMESLSDEERLQKNAASLSEIGADIKKQEEPSSREELYTEHDTEQKKRDADAKKRLSALQKMLGIETQSSPETEFNPNESETSESVRKSKKSQNRGQQIEDEASAIESAKQLSINAENCMITADNIDINVEGLDLESYFGGNEAAPEIRQHSEQQTAQELPDISEIASEEIARQYPKPNAAPIVMSDILSELSEIGSPEMANEQNSQSAYWRANRQNVTRLENAQNQPENPVYEYGENALTNTGNFRNPNAAPMRPETAEMESISGRKYERSPRTNPLELSEINEEESNKRKKRIAQTESAESTEMPEVKKSIEESPALDGLESVFKMLKGEGETLLKSNKTTSKLFDLIKGGEKGGANLLSGFGQKASGIFEQGKQQYLGELAKGMLPQEMSGLNGIISTLTGGATEAGAALSGVSGILTALGPEVLVLIAGISLAANALKKSFAPAVEGTKKLLKESEVVVGRFFTSQKNNLETAQKRLLEDVRTIVEEPFNILKKGAEEWYNAWDSNLRTINATQGYTKADLQNLMASFADRLRSEGLTSVVSATDITNSLTKVLSSGLSGEIAEEFAYIATKLNAAVPTQDFFSYADTYASIAANAVRTGMSQTAAIEFANEQLTAFANNVLYASREVAGGFTTGLQNAEALFKQSVQIAQAGRSYNATEISGVLTAVSAITGAIAPDLASAMTDAIYRAAVGGNSTEIVALRSMAGINASNTEFLQALTSNPKRVFVELFKELGKRQNMSEDAYMEVAEGLSGIFGLSADTFARVDFEYLSQAIDSMETASSALEKNMMLLASGETTTNAEQLKIQEINKMILDEGLSYVLDNEAARAIQQHMWDEQIARELQEAEYGVNLQGAALEFLRGIKETVYNILNILNPLHWIQKIAELQLTYEEGDAIKDDVAQVLELGKVGQGNERSRYELVTRNQDLNVISDLVTLLGGKSSFASAEEKRKNWQSTLSPLLGVSNAKSAAASSKFVNSGFSELTPAQSQYGWQSIGKSAAAMASSSQSSNESVTGISDLQNQSEQSLDNADTMYRKNLQSMIDSMEGFIQNNPEANYKDWLDTARSFGIADFESAIADAGLSNAEVQGYFDALQTKLGSIQKKEREDREDSFWKDTGESLTTQNALTTNISGSVGDAVNELKSVSTSMSEAAIHLKAASEKIGILSENSTVIKESVSEINGSITTIKSDINDPGNGIRFNVSEIHSVIRQIDSKFSYYKDEITKTHIPAIKKAISDQTLAVLGNPTSTMSGVMDKLSSATDKLGEIYNAISDGVKGLPYIAQELQNFHITVREAYYGESGIVGSMANSNNNNTFNEDVIGYLAQILSIMQNGGTPVVTQLPNSLIGLSGALEGARGGYL